jgi:hypothetical protein
MTNLEIAALLGQAKGNSERKLLGEGKKILQLMSSDRIKGYLTAGKGKLALPSNGSGLFTSRSTNSKRKN